MAQNISALNREKGFIKSRITRLETFLDSVVESVDKIKELEINVKLESQKKVQNDIWEIRKKMCTLPEETDYSELDSELESMESRVENIQVRLLTLIKDINKESKKNCESKNMNTESFKITSDIKLPRLLLPNFSGNIYEWITFSDLFKASVHDNDNLTDGQKLQYLFSCLRGDALRVVKSISISNENYKVAWSLLEDRYSSHREQVFAHIKRFMSIPVIQSENYNALLNLIDTTFECVRSLETLKKDICDFADTLFVYIILQKLDPSTKLWVERELCKSDDIPKLNDLIDFLKIHARTLQSSKVSKNSNQKVYSKSAAMLTSVKPKCIFCNDGDHSIYKCSKFKEISVYDRNEFIKKNKLCFNCFLRHSVKMCTSKYSCAKCNKKHNTLIHFERENKNSQSVPMQTYLTQTESSIPGELNPNAAVFEANRIPTSETQNFVGMSFKKNSVCSAVPYEKNLQFENSRIYTFLSTAVINIVTQNGEKVKIRALLDVGSQVSFLRKDIADILGLKQQLINAPISGLNDSYLTVKHKISALIESTDGEFKKYMNFLIVNNITDLTLSKPVDVSNVQLPKKICYADPNFNRPGKIDALLGAEIFYHLLKSNQIQLKPESIMLQETVFGWVVTGSLKLNEQENYHCGLVNTLDDVNNELRKFWELEAIGVKDTGEKENEDRALEIFNKTTYFKNGRYEVKLPWKINWKELKDNYNVAKKRIEILSKRMRKDENLYSEYCEILKSYLNEGIIERVLDLEKSVERPLFYLPHQVVIRTESLTTKIRIVFDASSHEVGELSLNDCLYQGVNLNPNIFHLLTYFRLNKVALISDIEKAFLQISLCEEDRDALRFLFLDDEKNMQVYKFRRITFGVNVSPFLLAATIKKHIEKYRKEFPTTVEILDNCFYVDDLIAGGDNLQSVLEISNTAEKIMCDAGMSLRKWISNSEELMKKWNAAGFKILNSENLTRLHRVLGLSWDPKSDCMALAIDGLLEFLNQKKNTKRFLLMAAGRIFDPLGFVTPFTIRFKCLFQEIWKNKLSWDEDLPPDICKKWTQWCTEIPQLKELRIPRYILEFVSEELNGAEIELHTFSDASAKAYGAVVYVKIKQEDRVIVNFVTSKTRVAPLKKISLPRLELMGALVAARLANEVKNIIDRKHQSTKFFWTDSQVTLYWIQSPSKKWKPFVANRVKEIQSLTSDSTWHHCPGRENPADMLTRGASVTHLLNSKEWWTGPSFLKEVVPEIVVPVVDEEEYCFELKKDFSSDNNDSVTLNITNNPKFVNELLCLSNNYSRLIRILSFLFRFFNNCKGAKRMGQLQVDEIREAEFKLIKLVQQQVYGKEFSCLEKEGSVSKDSKVRNLHPLVDERGVLRVGGRLANSNLSFDKKFPIILPKNHKLTELIVEMYHKKYLHIGPQGLLFLLRQRFWPLSGRNLCRKITHNCVVCFKAKPSTVQQLMGQLPQERIIPNFPFNCSGVDFCGPFQIKYPNQRKGQLVKVFICIFVCFATKACHLELVNDLSTNAFIATLKRFFSRRGKSSHIFSDNATNFVGSNFELKRLANLVKNPDESLANFLSTEGVEWKFIPPRAPHQGGLWEACVKSVKYHLKRVVGNHNLTYEEFLTVITQVEGILNSRPLLPLTSELNDFEVLTPAHFLIGRAITTIPEPSVVNVPENRLKMWQKLTKIVQNLWKNWSNNYLTTLQERSKWYFKHKNVKVGDMVIIKEDNSIVCKWPLGKIVEVFPGKDNKVRVVTVKTKDGQFKRPISKICLLPISDNL